MNESLIESIQTIYMIQIIMSACFAFIIAGYGATHFNKVFALVILVNGFVQAYSYSLLGMNLMSSDTPAVIYWTIVIGASVSFLLFGRVMAILSLFALTSVAVLITLRAVSMNSVVPDGALLVFSLILGAASAWMLRLHNIKVFTGISSGLCASVVAIYCLTYVIGESVPSLAQLLGPDAFTDVAVGVMAIIIATPAVFIALGVAFQYFWRERVFRNVPKGKPNEAEN